MVAQTNNVTLKYAEESTFGVKPTSGYKDLPYSSESVSEDIQLADSDVVRRDRMQRDRIQVSKSVSGDVNSDFSLGTFDEFLQACLASSWSGDTLKTGYDYKSFTVEKHYSDIDKYAVFNGMRVNSFNLNLPANDKQTCSIGFIGQGSQIDTESVTTEVPLPAPIKLMNTAGNVGNILLEDSTLDACLIDLSLSISNNLRTRGCIGKLNPSDILLGASDITGKMTMILNQRSWDLYGKVLSQTDSKFGYRLTDGDSYLTILLPRIRVNAPTPVASTKDGDVVIEFTFKALFDEGVGSNIVFNKIYGFSDGVEDWYDFFFLPYSGEAN